MTVLNYTTKVPAPTTIGEVQALLVKGGARSVSMTYDEHGRAAGISFVVETGYGVRSFLLPVPDLRKIGEIILREVPRDKQRPYMREPAQAERVAWRIVKDWLEAQLAIIKIEAVALDQVMLPYMTDDAGRTVYDLYVGRQLEIGPGS